jgi:hypothetical protein
LLRIFCAGHDLGIFFKKGTREMSFTIMQHDGMKVTQWFFNIDELIKSMLNNPKDRYHRNT